MTSLTTVANEQPSTEGRSVRDVVEYTPELVNEVWCRKIFRQILQSLERQYAMGMPHRAITPDTIVFHDNGEPLLAPAVLEDEAGHSEADDLTALAGVIHYAITQELAPSGPLHGRALNGYSDSLINAVDRCMAPDRAARPHDIAALRELLGMVTLGATAAAPAGTDAPRAGEQAAPGFAPAPAAAHAPASVPTPAQAVDHVPAPAAQAGTAPLPSFAAQRPRMSRRRRWTIAAGVGALAAIALAMFAEMRDSGSFDHIVLNQPQQAGAAATSGATRGVTPAPGAPAAAPAQAFAPASIPAAAPAGADGGARTPAPDAGTAPPAAADATAAPAPDAGLPAQDGAAPAARNGSASYRLRIQPWGVVYVDEVDRGVSPPVKRLTLPAGKHTLRISNPAFEDRVLELDTARGDAQIKVDFNDSH